jgi:hypothetical protein
MNRELRRLLQVSLIAILALLAGSIALAQSGGYDSSRWTVAGGGGMAVGGGYELIGTAGQPDAGALAGGGYTLSGGFWSGGLYAPYQTYLPLVLRGR